MSKPNPYIAKERPTKAQKAERFWQWFDKQKNAFLFINQVEREELDRLVDVFTEELHKYDPNVYFEMGGHPDAEKVELIITAQGNREFFFAVELLVRKAPRLDDWNIVAFKPPMGVDFTTEYGGMEFDPKKTLFIPLINAEAREAVGMCVCYPDYEEEDEDLYYNATYLMLDVILGEKAATLEIDHLEVAKTPDNIGELPFWHLSDVEEYINERRSEDRA